LQAARCEYPGGGGQTGGRHSGPGRLLPGMSGTGKIVFTENNWSPRSPAQQLRTGSPTRQTSPVQPTPDPCTRTATGPSSSPRSGPSGRSEPGSAAPCLPNGPPPSGEAAGGIGQHGHDWFPGKQWAAATRCVAVPRCGGSGRGPAPARGNGAPDASRPAACADLTGLCAAWASRRQVADRRPTTAQPENQRCPWYRRGSPPSPCLWHGGC
jgi:hypothetical protein